MSTRLTDVSQIHFNVSSSYLFVFFFPFACDSCPHTNFQGTNFFFRKTWQIEVGVQKNRWVEQEKTTQPWQLSDFRDFPHLEISSSFRYQSSFLRFVHFQLHGVLHALGFKNGTWLTSQMHGKRQSKGVKMNWEYRYI